MPTGDSTCSTGTICSASGLVGIKSGRFTEVIHSYVAGIGGLLGVPLTQTFEITASYRAQSGHGGIHRTLAQLRCPIMASQTCQMGTNTYVGWDNTIWNFGTSDDLPTLRDLPACPTFRPNCRH